MVTGNESVLIQLAQCRFPRLAISNSEILVYCSNKMYRSNFIKQHSETVVVWNYQNADCSLRKKCYCVIYYNFRHTFIPYFMASSHNRPVCCFFVPQLSFQFQYFLLQSVHNLHNTHTANNNAVTAPRMTSALTNYFSVQLISFFTFSAGYTLWVKKQDTKYLPITSPNVNRFSKFFHCQTQWQICNKSVFKYPTTP